MDFSTVLREVWKDIEAAYNNGYIVNESMMAFVLWKAVNELRPDLRFTYDARLDSSERFKPDLVVWQDGDEPAVLFICELKFVPDNYIIYEPDIEKLQQINKKTKLAVRTRNPKTGELVTTLISKSSEFTFGFFAISNWDAGAVTYSNVTSRMSDEEQAIFHFAFGSIPGCEDGNTEFVYRPPTTKAFS